MTDEDNSQEVDEAQEVDAHEFHNKVVDGTEHRRTFGLEDDKGRVLPDAEMHVVSKRTLTQAIDSMPDSVFNAVEDPEEDIDPEEAEELAQQSGGAQVTVEMYDAFEDLCKESIKHSDLSNIQMNQVVEELSFEAHFELGSEVLNFSLENSGSVTGFRGLN